MKRRPTPRHKQRGFFVLPGGLGMLSPGSSPYASAVLADSPRAYWRLGEAVGTVAIDSSGNNRPGTYAGSTLPTLAVAGLVPGDANTAASFSGTNGCRVEIPYGSWMTAAAISAEAICNVTSALTLIARRTNDSDVTNTTFNLRASGAMLIRTVASGTVEYGPIIYPSIVGARHHIVGTYDGSVMRVYVDGLLHFARFNGSPLVTLTNGGMFLMAAQTSGGVFGELSAGVADEFAYYGSALSQARIKAHAQAAGFTVTDYTVANVAATARGAWALRALNGYSGALIDVRRSSDNATRTINVSAGELDTADLLSWAGSSSVFVSKWYDQSGNAHHLLQTTNGSQPRIVNAGTLETQNGKPVINCTSGTFLEEASVIGNTDSFTIVYASDETMIIGRGQDTFGAGWSISMSAAGLSVVLTTSATTSYTAALPNTAGWQSRVGQLKNTTGASVLGATQASSERAQPSNTNSTLRSSTRGFCVGLNNGTSAPGKIGELLVWRSVINHGQIDALSSDHASRFGFTPA